MKKILIYSGNLKQGGAEKQALILASQASERGYKVSFLLDFSDNDYTEAFKMDDFDFIYTYYDKKNPIKKFFKVLNIIKREKPEIFITYLGTKNLIGGISAKLVGCKHIISNVRGGPEKIGGSINVYKYFVDKIVFNSKKTSLAAQKKFKVSSKKNVVINNAIELDRFSNMKLNSKNKFLCLGRINEVKNHFELLKAVDHLKNVLPNDFKLDIVGYIEDKELSNNLTEFIEKQNLKKLISIKQPVKDVNQLFKKYEALILTSKSEGFPNVIMEAMATKTFVIATDVGGVNELIEDGKTGIILKRSYYQDIMEGLRKYYLLDKSDKDIYISNAFEKIKEYSTENMFKKYEILWTNKD